MKRIDLNSIELDGKAEPILPILKQWLLTSPMDPTGRGLSIGEMRERLKVCDKFDAADVTNSDYVDLEDSEHAIVVLCVNNSKFGVCSKFIVETADRVLSAKEPSKTT